MSKVFMSYSHKDEELRDELEIHLSMLKRKGLISTWHDRKILPGDDFKNEIDENIEDADIILLLISPYFLDSDYCFDIELERALERHDNGEARVIPIILEHCHWQIAEFSKLQALPEDGRPVTDYPNQHKAFTQIAKGIRQAIQKSGGKPSGSSPSQSDIQQEDTSAAQRKDPQRSSNLRVRKSFSDKEKDDFLRNAFDYIYKFFKNSLEELEERSSFIDSNIERINPQTFTVKIYKEEKLVNKCKIWRGGDLGSSQAIKYSNSIGNRNSFNMMYTVEDDGYTQYLKSSGLSSTTFFDFDEKEDLSEKGASEQMWAMLIEPLQR
ncbi:toll/interleukin-1 receptor domain-containing protein [Aliifodinibius sp. S!AR15-10]|uniref:toll/interleukin-1 receptor domain-containing protein n=1 Tax=Aliifodinibius sp. S!AR15-10 TaxID=2950437 RepID=UPI002865CA05|nr:toll/interleukin-1 receptor domain-containing protein [Aliifodinibius sp. S!AR15-10]MDR8392250.1 toll/interleukin-1 receptor domain-containing protein [Aliifodinibius sp. S!AR15-10]